jgi:hypothetical protein
MILKKASFVLLATMIVMAFLMTTPLHSSLPCLATNEETWLVAVVTAVPATTPLKWRLPAGDHYLFLPHYKNSATAARVIARQFNKLMEETGLKKDAALQTDRTIYRLRHTAICMRLMLSEVRSTSTR